MQYAFRRHLNTSPLTYLRTVRLDLARRQLLAAAAASTTITEVAARWGFTASHFAALYRRSYGHPPTLDLHTQP
ncbi:hypothetical protein BIV57_01110 [Mangrovactinospora gilvigrisea]|uniref:HTH araC/xylS-type domain-containing protein n=1 Tax=Mangrovactinospora gilvigrisea TaxID=1428644 RepID=A0A1J7BL91_9ACTN|nr:helix-turn-helix domain-containing protein [Mangrovactinospora gilvigrisea]OIV39463.1 hypothetical protein BIV57_01110 [Mangrovactinospora gilvigrisea]